MQASDGCARRDLMGRFFGPITLPFHSVYERYLWNATLRLRRALLEVFVNEMQELSEQPAFLLQPTSRSYLVSL